MSRRPFIPRTQNAGASSTMQESSMMQTRPLLTEPHSPSSGRKLPSSPLPPSPRLAMFPQPHEPSSPTRSADSVARGEWGTAYGPYTVCLSFGVCNYAQCSLVTSHSMNEAIDKIPAHLRRVHSALCLKGGLLILQHRHRSNA